MHSIYGQPCPQSIKMLGMVSCQEKLDVSYPIASRAIGIGKRC